MRKFINWLRYHNEFVYIFIGLYILFTSNLVYGLELVRQKNVATYIQFPIMKNDGTRISAATGIGVYYSTMTESGVSATTAAITGITEQMVGSGIYYLPITQAQMNNDYLVITATSTSASSVPQTILIRTIASNPHYQATTDDGGTINVTGGAVDNATTITTYTGNTPQTGDSYAQFTSTWTVARANKVDNLDATISSRGTGTSTLTTSDNIGLNWADIDNPTTAQNLSGTNIKTDQVVASVSGAVGSVAGGVTVTTNNDKTGYALAFAQYTNISNNIFGTSLSTYVYDGSAGGYIVNASTASAGDPWSTLIPAAYGVGTGGYILGHMNDYIIPTSTGVAHIDNNLPGGGGTDF